jgi:hypothetical protein
VRGSELVADPAHALALEASKQRRTGHARVHLATHARATHASDPGEGAAHELIFSLCSSAPDGGGLSTEAELLDLHLSYWQAALATLVPSVEVHLLVWDTSLAALLEGRGVLDRVTVTKGADPTPWRNPYATAAFRLVASGEHPVVLGDGGFVPWTQALTATARIAASSRGSASTPSSSSTGSPNSNRTEPLVTGWPRRPGSMEQWGSRERDVPCCCAHPHPAQAFAS